MDWFDKAAEELESQLENGDITQKEFWNEMRELRQEYRESQCSCDHYYD